jgi:ABC-type multidrug transport system fused ATPase/permease subunit
MTSIAKLFELVKPFFIENKHSVIKFMLFTIMSYPLKSLVIPSIFGSFFENVRSGDADYMGFFLRAVFFTLIINLAVAGIGFINSELIPKFNEYVHNYIYEKMLTSLQNTYTEIEIGKILSRLGVLPSIIREITTDLFTWIIPKFLTIIFIIGFFFNKSLGLGTLATVLIVLVTALNLKNCDKCLSLSEKRYKSFEGKNENLQDKLSNLFSIFSAGNLTDELNENRKFNEQYRETQIRANMCGGNVSFINSFVQCVMFLSLNGFAVYMHHQKMIPFGTLVALNMMITHFIPAVTQVMGALPNYTNHIGILKSLESFIEDIEKPVIGANKKIQLESGTINIHNLKFGYGKDELLFDNFNLDIQNGEHIALVGESGNGKSSLVKLIMGYFPIEPKMIFIDGNDIYDTNLESLRNQIIFINQTTRLFNTSIYENIQYGNNITIREIDAIYNKYGMAQIFDTTDNGLNSDSGVGGEKLSGGQKQLVQIIRAYGKSKMLKGMNKIFIFDEPTASLDPETKKIIVSMIKELTKGSTTIIITHEYNVIKELVTRSIKILDGKIVN